VTVVTLALLGLASSAASAVVKPDPGFGDDGIVRLKGDWELLGYDRHPYITPIFQGAGGMDAYRGRLLFTDGNIWRLGNDGEVDWGFGDGDKSQSWRKLDSPGYGRSTDDLERLQDGSVVVTGFYQASNRRCAQKGYVAKYDAAGKVDASFGNREGRIVPRQDGWLCYKGVAFRAVEVDSRNRILVGGKQGRDRFLRVDRYLADGRPDRSFGKGGRLLIRNPLKKYGAAVNDLRVLRSGKILATGVFKGRFFILRLMPDGRIDRSFGKRGWVGGARFGDRYGCLEAPCGSAQIGLSANGSITVSGTTLTRQGFAQMLVRLRPDGRLIRSFGRNGILRFSRKLTSRLMPELSAPIEYMGRSSGGFASLKGGRTFVLMMGLTSCPEGMTGRRNCFAARGAIVDRRGRVRTHQVVDGDRKEVFFVWLEYNSIGIEPDGLSRFYIGADRAATPEAITDGRYPTIFRLIDR